MSGRSKLEAMIFESFEGVCLTTVILTSGASPGGCLLWAMSHFDGIRGIDGIRGCVHFGSKLRPLSKLSVLTLEIHCTVEHLKSRMSKNTRFLSVSVGLGPKNVRKTLFFSKRQQTRNDMCDLRGRHVSHLPIELADHLCV